MTREITAFPSPLPEAEVDFKAIEANENLKRLLALKPEHCNCEERCALVSLHSKCSFHHEGIRVQCGTAL
jgi:hypothetical protein